ncbi:MAG: alcohol dehydrogenase catalytic domain-containing protein [Caldiserica bacterium]|nr:alcohol dehydrogenase catalytic domain-containing protein [Caldisericota bacterium]MDH7561887.1 alcohol dehydrogenase catalytic domain-containing protein [Caldisericota bacterium]
MKAIVKTKPQPGAELLDAPTPRIAPDQVLVKVRATSICGTDVHIYKWDPWAQGRIGEKRLPQILGHEVAGEVVEVGSHVSRIKIGDYVSAETHIYDPGDLTALLEQKHLGEHMKILGVDCDGAFAEYIAVPERVCWKNDPSLPPEFATLQEPLGNAVYAVLGEDYDVAGKTMVIFGDGPAGVLSAGVARVCGATKIFLVGRSAITLEVGKKMGADYTLTLDLEPEERISFVLDHTGGNGADIVLEMAGNPQAVLEGFKVLRRGGRFTAFGVLSSPELNLDYNNSLVFKGIQVHGINGRKIFDTWYRASNFLSSGRLDLSPLITHMFPLEDFEKGFQAVMHRPRNCLKVVLFPHEKELEIAQARRSNNVR